MNAYHKYLLEGEQHGMAYRLRIPPEIFSGRQGQQIGHAAGTSLDFRDFRDYQPGDDLRRIDWGAYGRSDRLLVKLFREENEPHADILIDTSRSMNTESKAGAALRLVSLLGTAARNAKCSCRTWMTLGGCHPVENSREPASAWQGISFSSRLPLPEELSILPPRWRNRSIRILISDLLFPGKPAAVLSRLVGGAAALSVIQILSEADLRPSFYGNVRIRDAESGEIRELFFDDAGQKLYQDRLEQHRNSWYESCRSMGIPLTVLTAEELMRDWNIDPLLHCGCVELR